MPPRAITGFYPGKYPVNHDATKLTWYLVALTVTNARLITLVPSRVALPYLADTDETAPGTVPLRGVITTLPPDKAL
jgi:hypothetical protein